MTTGYRRTVSLCYWVIVFLLYWAALYQGPPVRVLYYYYLHKTCAYLAYRLGRVNMHAELQYHRLKGEVWT